MLGDNNPAWPIKRSYSIEAEDLLIDRVLTAVVGAAPDYIGTYLDIGAFHPVRDSNTYLFYERGWRGICVEPNPDHVREYAIHRPGDKVVNIGLAARTSTLRYHKFSNSGLNGFYDQYIVDVHKQNGQNYLGSTDIACIGVNEFLSEHVDIKIDFMDIDIETVEVEVLGNWDWSRCRPSVICAEIHSTDIADMLRTETAKILISAGYSAMSRGWQSSIFVANEILKKAV